MPPWLGSSQIVVVEMLLRFDGTKVVPEMSCQVTSEAFGALAFVVRYGRSAPASTSAGLVGSIVYGAMNRAPSTELGDAQIAVEIQPFGTGIPRCGRRR